MLLLPLKSVAPLLFFLDMVNYFILEDNLVAEDFKGFQANTLYKGYFLNLHHKGGKKNPTNTLLKRVIFSSSNECS